MLKISAPLMRIGIMYLVVGRLQLLHSLQGKHLMNTPAGKSRKATSVFPLNKSVYAHEQFGSYQDDDVPLHTLTFMGPQYFQKKLQYKVKNETHSCRKLRTFVLC